MLRSGPGSHGGDLATRHLSVVSGKLLQRQSTELTALGAQGAGRKVQGKEARIQESGARRQEIGDRRQRSEIRRQKSEVRSQKSEKRES